MTALVQPIISIPLNKLVAWNGNVRKTGETDGIEELRASIAAHGVPRTPPLLLRLPPTALWNCTTWPGR